MEGRAVGSRNCLDGPRSTSFLQRSTELMGESPRGSSNTLPLERSQKRRRDLSGCWEEGQGQQ